MSDSVDLKSSEGGSEVLKIGGIQKFSTLDYPGKISAIVFCQGCPNRCVYCHNPEFIDTKAPSSVTFDELLSFLSERRGLLDAVVFSGGDPLIQSGLPKAMSIVKGMGFLIGLHTSGVASTIFDDVLKIVDWVGYDIKTTFENYEKITRLPLSGILAQKNFEKLIKSSVNFEIRTTVDSRFISSKDLVKIAKYLSENNISSWVLQECILRNDDDREKLPLPDPFVIEELEKYIKIEIRRE